MSDFLRHSLSLHRDRDCFWHSYLKLYEKSRNSLENSFPQITHLKCKFSEDFLSEYCLPLSTHILLCFLTHFLSLVKKSLLHLIKLLSSIKAIETLSSYRNMNFAVHKSKPDTTRILSGNSIRLVKNIPYGSWLLLNY